MTDVVDPTNPKGVVCRHCYELLNTRNPTDSDVVWRHGYPPEEYDHEPDPIPRSEAPRVNHRCDFCDASNVPWVYPTSDDLTATLALPTTTGENTKKQVGSTHPVRALGRNLPDFEVQTPEAGPPIPVSRTVITGGWFACDNCSRQIEIDDLERFISYLRRIKPNVAARTRNWCREFFGAFYAVRLPRVRLNEFGDPITDNNQKENL